MYRISRNCKEFIDVAAEKFKLYMFMYINNCVSFKFYYFVLESLCFIIVQLLAVLFTALAGLATFSWWIADVVIFAQNSRLSGNGCVLAT